MSHIEPIAVFIGYDNRQPVAFHVAAQSIMRHASRPVSITPLVIDTLPVKRTGLTEFTFSRFLVPHLCGYVGSAVFMDADVMVRGDVAELIALADPLASVSVSKNALRFEWASVMVFRNALCRKLTPEYVQSAPAGELFGFDWANGVGDLPPEWNHLVGYDEPRADAKLAHFTQGIPCFDETKDSEHSAEWNAIASQAMSTCSWQKIMGNSVHVEPVMRRLGRTAA